MAVTLACGAPDAGRDAPSTTVVAEAVSVPAIDVADADLLAAIPDARVPALDLPTALSLVALPLSCIDRPHAAGRDRSGYLDDVTVQRRPGYERDRSFYGCWDWHSAVNSTWAMVRIVKQFPDLPVEKLVREKLRRHLAAEPLAGELEFFRHNRGFERPYGWAWLLLLQAELRTWDDPEAATWADNLEPLVRMLAERTVAWLAELERPSRSGTHSNTAFAMAMMLDASGSLGDSQLAGAIDAAARRLFLDDVDCPTAYEPWGSDFLSPCLEEAKLMARVLGPDDYSTWLDGFLPAVDSPRFRPLTTPLAAGSGAPAPGASDRTDGEAARGRGAEGDAARSAAGDDGAPPAADHDRPADVADAAERDRRRDEQVRALAARSHLIGLAFIRAEAMHDIAAALPATDRRAVALRKLAALHGETGFAAMFDADYAGSHWIGTFALKYLLAADPGH